MRLKREFKDIAMLLANMVCLCGNILDQQMPSAHQGHDHFIEHFALADDDPRQIAFQAVVKIR